MVFERIKRKIKSRIKKKVGIIKSLETSPYLILMSQNITSIQDDNGSWFNNPLLTCTALRALHEVAKVSNLNFDDFIRSGLRYLKERLEDLSNEILSSTTLYFQLDVISLTFSKYIHF